MSFPFLWVPPLVRPSCQAHTAIPPSAQAPVVFLSFHSEEKGKAGGAMGEGSTRLLSWVFPMVHPSTPRAALKFERVASPGMHRESVPIWPLSSKSSERSSLLHGLLAPSTPKSSGCTPPPAAVSYRDCHMEGQPCPHGYDIQPLLIVHRPHATGLLWQWAFLLATPSALELRKLHSCHP